MFQWQYSGKPGALMRHRAVVSSCPLKPAIVHGPSPVHALEMAPQVDFTWVLYCPRDRSQGPRSVARCNHCTTLVRKSDLYRYHGAGAGRCHAGLSWQEVRSAITAAFPAGTPEHEAVTRSTKLLFDRTSWRLFHNRVGESDLLDDILADALAGYVIHAEQVAASHGLAGNFRAVAADLFNRCDVACMCVHLCHCCTE